MFVGFFAFVNVCCRLIFCCLIVLLNCNTIFVIHKAKEKAYFQH